MIGMTIKHGVFLRLRSLNQMAKALWRFLATSHGGTGKIMKNFIMNGKKLKNTWLELSCQFILWVTLIILPGQMVTTTWCQRLFQLQTRI